MIYDIKSDKPIFMQLSEWIEDAILSGAFEEETQIPSTTKISVSYKINPATALKGMNLLVDEGIIYKKRGVGMFVSKGAAAKILHKRQKAFYENYIRSLIDEAEKLKISKEEIITMIRKGV